MIVTDRFIFLHLHKSGGTFVNECLLRFVPGARQLGYHLPRKLIPAELARLPVLGLVRSPWSYYVSWYTFQSSRGAPNVLYRVLSEDGRLDFAGTLRNMLALSQSPARLDRLLESLPVGYVNRGLNLPRSALEPIRGSGLGFYAYLYHYMYGASNELLNVGRMESLRRDLPRLLESVGQVVSGEMLEFLSRAAPRNASRHAQYPEYYDAELRDMVAECDAPVIARHGYRFGE
jgi:hypothetical protein